MERDPPIYKSTTGDTGMRHVLSFQGSVAASSRVTLVSVRLGFPYQIKHIRVKFALGQVGLVQHTFYVSNDDAAPTAAIPSGQNILAQYGNVDYLLGDDDVLDMDDETYVARMPTWLKVHAYNADTDTHTINALITIEDFRKHPDESLMKEILGEEMEQAGSSAQGT